MSKYGFEDQLQDHLAGLERQGFAGQVITIFDARSAPARAIHGELKGTPIPDRPLRPQLRGALHTLTRPEVERLLRRHAGLGGGLVAGLLDSPPVGPDYWMLALHPEHLPVSGWIKGRLKFESGAYYNQLPYALSCPDCEARAHRDVVPVRLAGGTSTAICVLRAGGLCRTAALVRMAYDRALPPLTRSRNGLPMPVGEGIMGEALRRFYRGRPAEIAEAVRALRKVDGGHGDWLLAVLAGGEDLRDLYDAVAGELAAEEP
jgi:hypothetical protein